MPIRLPKRHGSARCPWTERPIGFLYALPRRGLGRLFPVLQAPVFDGKRLSELLRGSTLPQGTVSVPQREFSAFRVASGCSTLSSNFTDALVLWSPRIRPIPPCSFEPKSQFGTAGLNSCICLMLRVICSVRTDHSWLSCTFRHNAIGQAAPREARGKSAFYSPGTHCLCAGRRLCRASGCGYFSSCRRWALDRGRHDPSSAEMQYAKIRARST